MWGNTGNRRRGKKHLCKKEVIQKRKGGGAAKEKSGGRGDAKYLGKGGLGDNSGER